MIINLTTLELKEICEHYFNNIKFRDEKDLYVVQSAKVPPGNFQNMAGGLEINLVKKMAIKTENKAA